MSEFDVAGNVFGVISLGIQVSAGLFNFIQVARGAPRDLETAHNDILALCAILEQLRDILISGGSRLNSYLIEKALANCSNIFGTVQNEVGKPNKNLQLRGSTAGKIMLSLKESTGYFYKESNILKLRMDIQNSKLTFLLALNLAQLQRMGPEPATLELLDRKSQERIQLITSIMRLNEQIDLTGNNVFPGSSGPRNTQAQQLRSPDHLSTALVKTDHKEVPSSHVAKPFKTHVSAPYTGESAREDSQVASVRIISTEGTSTKQSTRRYVKPGEFHRGVDNWLSDITESSTTSVLQPYAQQRCLEAWMMDVNVDTDPPDIRCSIHPVELQQEEILEYMKLQKELNAAGTLEFLSNLNNVQRPILLRHLQSVGGELVMANFCDDGQAFNFGALTLQTLMWITEKQKHYGSGFSTAAPKSTINAIGHRNLTLERTCHLRAMKTWIRRRMHRTPKAVQQRTDTATENSSAASGTLRRRESIINSTKEGTADTGAPGTSFGASHNQSGKLKRREPLDVSTEENTDGSRTPDDAHARDESSLLQTDPIEEIEIDKKEAEEIIQRLMAKWIED